MANTTNTLVKELNIKKVFYEKNPKLARFIPGFVFKYLQKIGHEQEMNEFLRAHGNKTNVEFIEAAMADFNITLEVEGTKNLPKDEKFIFASNHPLGGFDGLLILKTIHDIYGPTKALVNDILMNIINIKELFIPVNKHGREGVEFLQRINDAYNSDCQILNFPSGLVSRKIQGQVMDFEWQKSFIVKAKEYKRDVIPMFITGNNTEFFYRLSNIRTKLGIKANIEMLYLVDETYKHKNKKFKIIFGNPIPYTTFDKSKRPTEWAKYVKEQAYRLNNIHNVPV